MPEDTAGLGYSPFARRYWGNRYYFLLLRVLRCFSSPRSPAAIRGVTGSLPPGCPIRISRGQRVFAPRPGFSQLVTSFFASESLGIPHAPFQFRYILIPSSGISIFSLRNHLTTALKSCLSFRLKASIPPAGRTSRDARLLYSLFLVSSRFGSHSSKKVKPSLPACHCALPV